MSNEHRAARVVLFDDLPRHNALFADELEESGVEVVGVASTAAEMCEIVQSVEFDVAILDLLVGPTDDMLGLSIGIWLRTHLPHVGVLMFTSDESPFPALRLLNAGPTRVGYLLKNRVRETGEIISAIECLRAQQNAIDSRIKRQLIAAKEQAELGDHLTPAQLTTLELIVDGKTNEQIADELNLSQKTVEARLTDIFHRLGIGDAGGSRQPNRRVSAVLLWVNGLKRFRNAKEIKQFECPAVPPKTGAATPTTES